MFNRCLTKKESGKVFFKKQDDKRIEELEEKVRMLENPEYAERKKILNHLDYLTGWVKCDSIMFYSNPVSRENSALKIYEYFKIPDDEEEQ